MKIAILANFLHMVVQIICLNAIFIRGESAILQQRERDGRNFNSLRGSSLGNLATVHLR